MLYLARDANFDGIYQNVGDNRRLRGELEVPLQTLNPNLECQTSLMIAYAKALLTLNIQA